jgi:Putative outer membrane beta-barrel porin, MtrB/PioB
MNRKLLTLVVAGLLASSSAAQAADEEPGCRLFGSIGTGFQASNVNARDPSKFNEYRDMSNGVLPNFEFKGRCADNYMNAYGENLGRDDQYLDLNGGQYGVFKYRLYDNELRHRFGQGNGAITPFSGAGSNSLTAPFTAAAGILNTNPLNWNTFDNSYKRQDVGGMFELSNNSPFYVRLDGNQIKRNGIKVLSGANGTSPGNGFTDLPSPVDYTDNNLAAEVGYNTKRGHVAINVSHNRFTNGNSLLNWTNGFFGGTDTTVLAPESNLTKIAMNGNLRQLPYNSIFAGRVTYSATENNVPVLGSILSNTGGLSGNANPNRSLFTGDVIHQTASFSLNSQPLNKLDTKMYFNYNRKDNRSSQVTFSPLAAPAANLNLQCPQPNGTNGPCVTEVYNYKKNNVGFEGGYRLNADNRVVAAVDYTNADYERIDYTHAIDRKYSLEWKNSSFEMLDTRAKYQRLVRTSSFVDTGNFNTFQRRFDLASVTQNLGKVVFDINPQPLLALGLEAIYKHNDFIQDTQTLGRTKDERGELYANVGYGNLNVWRVSLFADGEYVTYDSVHRVGAVPANGNPAAAPAPAAPAVSTSYTYGNRVHDKSYMVGLSGDWVPKEKWKLYAAAIWMKTSGTVDLTAQGGAIIGAPGLVPVSNLDNTTTVTLNMKGTYAYSKSVELTGGYAYQHYTYSNIGTDNYKWTVPSGTSTAFASGMYAFPQSNSNTVYGFIKYKFQ